MPREPAVLPELSRFQVSDAVNDHTSSDLPKAEPVRRCDPTVPVRGELEG